MGRPFCLTITPMIVGVFLPFLLSVSMVSCIAMRRTTSNLTTQEDYFQNVHRLMGSDWYRMAAIHADELAPGIVSTSCEIPAAGGRVRNLKVRSNTSNRVAEKIAREVILKLRMPPIRARILQRAHRDYLVFERHLHGP